MKNYQNDYLSEFEREFEISDESNEFESENDEFESEGDGEYDSESEAENDFESEGDYLSEFESDSEYEFENTPEGQYEARLYEIFSNNYENEFEFENDLNQVMHELERDFFFKKWKNKITSFANKNPWVKKLANKALNAIPGGAGDMIRKGLKDPRGFLKTMAMKYGPQIANMYVPGSGVALKAMMGSNEMEEGDYARQAARDTVALAQEAYTNFAQELNQINLSRDASQAKSQLNQAAQNSFKKAYRTVKLGSKKHRYVRVNRKVEDVTIQGRPHKKVTILYKQAS